MSLFLTLLLLFIIAMLSLYLLAFACFNQSNKTRATQLSIKTQNMTSNVVNRKRSTSAASFVVNDLTPTLSLPKKLKNDDDTLNSIKAIIEEIFPPEEARNLNSSKIIQSISENVDAQLVEIVQASIKVAQKTSTINKHLSITSLKRGMELVRNEYKNVKKEAPISFVGETTRLIQVTHNNKYAKMFYLSGNDVNLNSEANNFNSFPPLEPIFDIHWLAVEGEQPKIVENEQINAMNEKKSSDGNDEDAIQVHLTKEVLLYFENCIQVLINAESLPRKIAEQNIINLNLSNDPVVESILPPLIRYANLRVSGNLHNLKCLHVCLFLIESLIENNQIKTLELYLQEVMPLLLTCILREHLFAARLKDDHFEIRKYASSILNKTLARFSARVPNLQLRVVSILSECLVNYKETPQNTLFGAIVALTALGKASVCNVLLPCFLSEHFIPDLLASVTQPIKEVSSSSAAVVMANADEVFVSSFEAQNVLSAVVESIRYVKSDKISFPHYVVTKLDESRINAIVKQLGISHHQLSQQGASPETGNDGVFLF